MIQRHCENIYKVNSKNDLRTAKKNSFVLRIQSKAVCREYSEVGLE
jgi:hypothetical protein